MQNDYWYPCMIVSVGLYPHAVIGKTNPQYLGDYQKATPKRISQERLTGSNVVSSSSKAIL